MPDIRPDRPAPASSLAVRAASLVALCLMFFAIDTGCARRAAPDAASAGAAGTGRHVEIVRVGTGDFRTTTDVPVTIEGDEEATLISRIDGYVGEVFVDIGREVRQGQVLAKLHVPEMRAEMQRRKKMVAKVQSDINSREAEVRQAEARLAEQQTLIELRKIERARMAQLVNGGALKQEQLDQAQYALKAAKAAADRCRADVATAQAHVVGARSDLDVAGAELIKSQAMASYTSIAAPFDGLIVRRMVDPGALVRPAGGNGTGTPLLEISAVSKVRGIVFVPMDDASQLDTGDRVTLHDLQGLPGAKVDAAISRTAKAFQRGSRMMRAEIDLDNPLDPSSKERKFKPGDYGKATIVLNEYKQLPSVPTTAIGHVDSRTFVVVVDQDRKCSIRQVDVVASRDGISGLRGNIRPGERVIAREPGLYQEGEVLTAEQLVAVKGE